VKRFLRYGGVGAVATAVHYALLVLWVEALGWPAPLGSAAGAIVGAQVAFFGNRAWTFGHDGPVAPAWVKFMGTALLGAAVGAGMVALVQRSGGHYLVGQVLATLASLVITFVVNRAWTFR
jgi:putative flippase GtrA